MNSISNRNLFAPKECEESAEKLAMKDCHWLNRQPQLIRYTNEYKQYLAWQLVIHYWEELYNLFKWHDGNNN